MKKYKKRKTFYACLFSQYLRRDNMFTAIVTFELIISRHFLLSKPKLLFFFDKTVHVGDRPLQPLQGTPHSLA